VSLDQKRVRQAQSDKHARGPRLFDGKLDGIGGSRRVEHVALDIDRGRRSDVGPLDGIRADYDPSTKVGRHRSPRVRGDHHQALARRRPASKATELATHADSGQVALVSLA
jgi:hypothetical protein